MDWISSILKPLFSSLFNAINEWWKAEKAASAEWEGKARKIQMESLIEGKRIETEAFEESKKAVIPATPTDWNKMHCGGAVLLLISFIFLSGCFRFYVSAREYKPILKIPPAPELKDTETPWNNREKKIVKWSSQLKSIIEKYNLWAKNANEENGYIK
jgi:hypothetical protein